MSSSDTEQSSMICDNGSTEFRDVVREVNQVFRLFSGMNIIEMNVFVTPLEVMNDSFICEFLLKDEDILEEI